MKDVVHHKRLLASRCLLAALAAALASACASTGPAVADNPRDCLAATTLGQLPNGHFLENLAVAPDGDVYLTDYFARTVRRYDRSDGLLPFATLDAYPASILPTQSGFLVAAHKEPFSEPAAFAGTGRMVLLDGAGATAKTIPLPEIGFANGIEFAEPGEYYIADSLNGAVWLWNSRTDQLELLVQSDLLKPEFAPIFLPGANGVKRSSGFLYVSSSAARSIFRIPLDATGRARGELEVYLSGVGTDDFDFLPDGRLVIATHGRELLVTRDAGAPRNVLCDDANAPTAVRARSVSGQTVLFVTTTGHLLEGGNSPATLLQVRLPAQN